MTTNSTGCISHISIVQDEGVVLQRQYRLQRKYRSQLRVMSIQVMRAKKKIFI
jgi:hypothetical protein